jgi:hypothetical protein
VRNEEGGDEGETHLSVAFTQVIEGDDRIDTDHDGVPDYRDLDSDDDGEQCTVLACILKSRMFGACIDGSRNCCVHIYPCSRGHTRSHMYGFWHAVMYP